MNKIELIEIKSQAKYWLVRAEGGRYYDQFKYEHFISVHHNEMRVADFYSKDLLLTEEKTIEYYKEQIARKHEEDKLSKQQITFAAKKLYNFIEGMSIGDYVVVPSKKSNKFIIGQITSDVQEIESAPNLLINYGYDRNADLKRRSVRWINEVPRKKVNAKFLYSTLTLHHSIIEITEYDKYINSLISPFYFKNGKLNLKLNVNTEKPVTSTMWSALYNLIDDKRNLEIDEEITVTSNVESPGDINLTSVVKFVLENQQSLKSGLVAIAILFGEVDVFGVKFNGLFPYIHNKKIRDLEKRKLTVEVEKIEKDSQLDDLKRQIEIEKSRKELQDIRELDITIDTPNVSYENEPQRQMDLDLTLDEE
ncbi:hypothetical protein [Lactococcus cremoris]|uniref:hypothetical protein n=1 Tax=Lactococcus lactis subsp. cremoris TaxID=1359 RepID=UPI0003AB78BD|nr:hypothetical protein [Lactococcus cremoris]AGV73794.1 hypothetical protein kw2_1840 [Lactococcus cremoris subsp. cremoris KW2]